MATEDDELLAIRRSATQEAAQIRSKGNRKTYKRRKRPAPAPLDVAEMPTKRYAGTISMVNYTMGWGLILLDGGGTVYFHRSGLQDIKSFVSFARRKKVQFSLTITNPELGPRAIDIVLFDEAQAA